MTPDQRLQQRVEAKIVWWRDSLKRALAGMQWRDRRIRELEAKVAYLREQLEGQSRV